MAKLVFHWLRISLSLCMFTVSGSYTTADSQLELSWQVCWWCTGYKTTWLIPGDIFAGPRAVNYPGVSCNPDYTDTASWLRIIFSTALYGLNSVPKTTSKAAFTYRAVPFIRQCWTLIPRKRWKVNSLAVHSQTGISVARSKSRSIHSTPLLSPHWGGKCLPIMSLANALMGAIWLLGLQAGDFVCLLES